MSERAEARPISLVHGARDLPKVTVDTYNEELREGGGFLGDRANKGAFAEILDNWRERLRRLDDDPFGDTPTEEISKKKLDKILAEGDPEPAGLVQGAIEEFASELGTVLRGFLKLKSWRQTERIVVGGGLRNSRVGELAIGRAAVLLKTDGVDIDLAPIRNHPDEAGLIGAVHLVPSWIMSGHDAILAVDIGGTNMRAGIVTTDLKKHPDLSKASVAHIEHWRHADDKPKREEAVERLIDMLRGLVKRAGKEKLTLAPFIGVGCPGLLRDDGTIERGGQNLPGNWESKRFSIAARIKEDIPRIGDHETTVLMHNDAVMQGLSELPFMTDVTRWAVVTIGTGLGNARFTNKKAKEK
jgi:ROK family protein